MSLPLKMSRQKHSTPVRRNRESIGFIKMNTVSNLVKAFSQHRTLTPTPKDREDSCDSPVEAAPINSQITFPNELSSILPDRENDSYNGDSGYDSIGFRKRANTVATSSVTLQQRFKSSYEKFPNFKWRYLKYFGVDPKAYLSKLNVDFDDDVQSLNASIEVKIFFYCQCENDK